MQVDAATAGARDGAAHGIDDPQGVTALAGDLLDRRQSIEGLPGLADGKVERVGLEDRIAMTEL